MPGNAQLGAVLRDLRAARSLTLAAVARQAECAESLVSYVESGRRQLHPWLAARLDDIYRTGGAIAALVRGTNPRSSGSAGGVHQSDTLIVELPGGGEAMPLSRRELLASLGVGTAGRHLLATFDKATETIPIGDETLHSFEEATSASRPPHGPCRRRA